jgi:soluble lytic murein transglycosylase
LIYPTYYADLILPLTESLNLDPALVFALIRQESFYDPNALSIAGARGLMQIMPPTGADIAQRTSTANYTLESLWQPYRNIQFGAWYLRQMMDFFDNNQFAALAAYNAGPGRVQEWSPLLSDLDIFVAHIPLSEPQNYIRRIYLNLDNYREIYGVDQSTASTE